jgi:glutathione peroxidase
MLEKPVAKLLQIDVNGPNQAPLYKYLKQSKGGILGALRDNIKWNFAKFLIDRDGTVIERFSPTTSPLKLEVIHMVFHHCYCHLFVPT